MSSPDPARVPQFPETGGAVPPPDPNVSSGAAIPVDFRSPLEWLDLVYLLLFYLVGGVFFYFAVASVAGVAFHLPSAALRDSTTARASVLIVAQGLLSFATLAFLYLIVRARSAMPFWPAVGWQALPGVLSRGATMVQYALSGVGLALAAGMAGRYLDSGSKLPIEDLFRSRQSVLLLMALGILVAPLVEETVFRGCIYPLIARRFGLPVGVVVTGALFGLAHAQQLGGAWGQIVILISVGIVLTYVRARAGSVVASYFVHLGYNTILFAGFYFATGGLRYFPA
jgi:membrane protease YdiL (CAAX protease family)